MTTLREYARLAKVDKKRKAFVHAFVTSFLGAYAASIYTDACARGKHEMLYDLPVEDAVDIAEKAYADYINL